MWSFWYGNWHWWCIQLLQSQGHHLLGLKGELTRSQWRIHGLYGCCLELTLLLGSLLRPRYLRAVISAQKLVVLPSCMRIQSQQSEPHSEIQYPIFGYILRWRFEKISIELGYCKTNPRPTINNVCTFDTVICVPIFPAVGFGSAEVPGFAGTRTPSE